MQEQTGDQVEQEEIRDVRTFTGAEIIDTPALQKNPDVGYKQLVIVKQDDPLEGGKTVTNIFIRDMPIYGVGGEGVRTYGNFIQLHLDEKGAVTREETGFGPVEVDNLKDDGDKKTGDVSIDLGYFK